MASTFSSSSSDTHLDRKSLRRPDGFYSAVMGFFGRLSQGAGKIMIAGAALLLVALAIVFYMNRMDARTEVGRRLLFSATKTLEKELTALAAKEKPPETSSAQKKGKTASSSSSEEGVKGDIAALTYKKFDVDSQLRESVAQLSRIDQEHGNTRPAFEARLILGDLYFKHGDYSKAQSWYSKAVESASSQLDKALALLSLGYSLENLGKPKESIEFLQKAVNLGEASLKGDLLLAIARNYEALHDSAQARSIYDKILTDLPNTEYARTAEVFKSQLQ